MRSFGTLIQEAPANPTPAPSKSVLDRFADIAAFTSGQMPAVLAGETYLLGDGTTVIALRHDGGQVVLYDPEAASLTWVARRDLAAHLTHVGSADPDVLARVGLASRLAEAFGTSLDPTVDDMATDLQDLLGLDSAHTYLNQLLDSEFVEGETSLWTREILLADAHLWRVEQADDADEHAHEQPSEPASRSEKRPEGQPHRNPKTKTKTKGKRKRKR